MSLTSRWAIGVWLAFIFSCVIIISRTQFSADLSAFLPRSPTPAQQLLVEQLRDGVVSRLLLIGLEGATPEVLAQTSKQLAAKLRKHADFVSIILDKKKIVIFFGAIVTCSAQRSPPNIFPSPRYAAL